MDQSSDEFWLNEARRVRKLSSCSRGKVGAVLVLDSHYAFSHYNGTPHGTPSCLELGCNVEGNEHSLGCYRTVHAEVNVILTAAREGHATYGSTLYCTHSPCYACAKACIVAGVQRFVYEKEYYRSPEGKTLLARSGVTLHRLCGSTEG